MASRPGSDTGITSPTRKRASMSTASSRIFARSSKESIVETTTTTITMKDNLAANVSYIIKHFGTKMGVRPVDVSRMIGKQSVGVNKIEIAAKTIDIDGGILLGDPKAFEVHFDKRYKHS